LLSRARPHTFGSIRFRPAHSGWLEPVAHLRTIDAQSPKQLGGGVRTVPSKQCEKEVARLDPRLPGSARLFKGAFEDFPRAGRERQEPTREDGTGRVTQVGDPEADCGQGSPVKGIRGGPRGVKVDPQCLGHGRVRVVQEPEQEVIGAKASITASTRFLRG